MYYYFQCGDFVVLPYGFLHIFWIQSSKQILISSPFTTVSIELTQSVVAVTFFNMPFFHLIKLCFDLPKIDCGCFLGTWTIGGTVGSILREYVPGTVESQIKSRGEETDQC